MAIFKITVEKLTDRVEPDRSWTDSTTLYEQQVEQIDLLAVIDAVNKPIDPVAESGAKP